MSIVLNALVWLIDDRPGTMWSICRKTLPSLKATAYRDILFLIDLLPEELKYKIHHNRTELSFSFGKKTIEFFSVDNQQKVRSRKRDYLHLVEANEIDYEDWHQMILRTKIQAFIDFNPDDDQVWIKTEIEETRALMKKDVDVIVSTYLDNPFLTKEEIAEIEYLKLTDPEMWRIFGEGQYGKLTGIIFPDITIIDEIPDHLDSIGGLDFGFTFHPSADVNVYKEGQRLFMDEVLYQRGLTNADLASMLSPLILQVADSAEPKSIEELNRSGLQVIPAVKGPDSIRNGISRMKEFELCVTARSINLLKEFRNYRWDPNRPNTPIDRMNHAIDAVRYVVQTKYKDGLEVGQSIKSNKFKPKFSRPTRGRAIK